MTIFTMIKDISNVLFEYYPVFLSGLWVTLKFSFIAVLFGTLLGALLAILHLSTNKILKGITIVYVTVIRGTPMLVQLYIAWFFLPLAIPWLNNFSKEVIILAALVLNSGAYVCEIIRSGINAVDNGQQEAARSLGMTKWHCLIKIIFPQAIKNILPALGNEYITMIKETSIASVLAIQELMFTRTILANHFILWESLFIVAGLYLATTCILQFFVNKLEKRLALSD